MLRHLFWDFDGTLYDSYPAIVRSFLDALSELGAPNLYTPEEALGLFKISGWTAARDCAKRAGIPAETIMDTYYRYHNAETRYLPYDGLKDCLCELHGAGFRHYLYTHRNRKAIDQLEADGLWELFDDAVIYGDGFPDKPAPDALLALMARNGVQPGEAAMIGDRDIDINAGHNAGMSGILFDPDGFYLTLPVEMRVSSMRELARRLLG